MLQKMSHGKKDVAQPTNIVTFSGVVKQLVKVKVNGQNRCNNFYLFRSFGYFYLNSDNLYILPDTNFDSI